MLSRDSLPGEIPHQVRDDGLGGGVGPCYRETHCRVRSQRLRAG